MRELAVFLLTVLLSPNPCGKRLGIVRAAHRELVRERLEALAGSELGFLGALFHVTCIPYACQKRDALH